MRQFREPNLTTRNHLSGTVSAVATEAVMAEVKVDVSGNEFVAVADSAQLREAQRPAQGALPR